VHFSTRIVRIINLTQFAVPRGPAAGALHVELSSRATFRASCSIFLCLLVLKKGGFSSYNSLFYLLSNDFFNVKKTTTHGEWLQILAPHSKKDIRLFVVDLYIFMCKLTASTCIVFGEILYFDTQMFLRQLFYWISRC
jgi:hypothetical protein